MPTYEYRCRDCGHELEAQQSFHDDPLTDCPVCGGELRKRFSPVGITFKGSGFYKTDSRSSSSGAGTGGTDSTSKEPANATSTTSDSNGSGSSNGSSGANGAAGSGSASKATSTA